VHRSVGSCTGVPAGLIVFLGASNVSVAPTVFVPSGCAVWNSAGIANVATPAKNVSTIMICLFAAIPHCGGSVLSASWSG
jgi:hypothetical protein